MGAAIAVLDALYPRASVRFVSFSACSRARFYRLRFTGSRFVLVDALFFAESVVTTQGVPLLLSKVCANYNCCGLCSRASGSGLLDMCFAHGLKVNVLLQYYIVCSIEFECIVSQEKTPSPQPKSSD